MSFDSLIPLIQKSKSTYSPSDFHHEVNVIFHDIEAEEYDQIHQDMWGNLLEQYQLLINDCYQNGFKKKQIEILDVGCGTGLGSELLLNTDLANYVTEINLLDVSSKMLEKALSRSQSWKIPAIGFNGKLAELNKKFDLILVSSVLHHIPDIENFINQIDSHLNPGGVFFHIHDPNGDFLRDSQLLKRKHEVASLDKVTTLYELLNSTPFFKNIFHTINRWRGKPNHIDMVNNHLLSKGVIKKRLNPKEIWSVTDIHVEGLPYSTNRGISLKHINELLPNYKLIGHRSYGFYGRLGVELPMEYQLKEKELINSHAKNGRYLAAAWKKPETIDY